MSQPLRILWIATKTPLPAIDGGRLLVVETLRALRDAGHRVTLVAPFPLDGAPSAELAGLCSPHLVADAPRPAVLDYLRARLRRSPYTLERHRRPRLRAEVARLLAAEPFDIVHAEQLHALAQAAPARSVGAPPVVLRQQNVESDLWSALAARGGLRGPFLAREAAALRRAEGEAVSRVGAVIAVTERDAERLRALTGGAGSVRTVRAPFPALLAPGEAPLPGAPALVLFGSDGWWPNRDQERWFLGEVWPRVRGRAPGARLHVFGGGSGGAAGVDFHPAPAESRTAFAPGAAIVVPVRIASGVRMKILEAWARGVAVVATPEAVAGLEGREEEAWLLAADAAGFARAVERLAAEPEIAPRLVAGGRQVLRQRHAPAAIAGELAALYRAAAGGSG